MHQFTKKVLVAAIMAATSVAATADDKDCATTGFLANPQFINQQASMKAMMDETKAQMEARRAAIEAQMQTVNSAYAPKGIDFSGMSSEEAQAAIKARMEEMKAQADAMMEAAKARMPQMAQTPEMPGFDAPKPVDYTGMSNAEIQAAMKAEFEANKARVDAMIKAAKAKMPAMPKMPGMIDAPEAIDFSGMSSEEVDAAMKAQMKASKARFDAMVEAAKARMPAMPKMPGMIDAPEAIDFSGMSSEEVQAAMKAQFDAYKAQSDKLIAEAKARMPQMPDMPGMTDAPEAIDFTGMSSEEAQAAIKARFEKMKAQADAMMEAAKARMPAQPKLPGMTDAPKAMDFSGMSSEEIQAAMKAQAKEMKAKADAMIKAAKARMPSMPEMTTLPGMSACDQQAISERADQFRGQMAAQRDAQQQYFQQMMQQQQKAMEQRAASMKDAFCKS